MEWTEETIERLRSLWQEGLSTAEIGRRMSITKNAVVGKAHRLVLSARPSPIRKVPQNDVSPSKPFKPARPAVEAPGSMARLVPRSASQPPVDLLADAEGMAAGGDGTKDNIMPLRAAQASAACLPQAVPATPLRAARPSLDADVDQPRPRHEPDRSSAVRSIGEPVRHRRSQSCCWPLGDPGTKQFRFCGGEPIPGKPYCVEHAQLAYVKLRDRRDTVA